MLSVFIPELPSNMDSIPRMLCLSIAGLQHSNQESANHSVMVSADSGTPLGN